MVALALLAVFGVSLLTYLRFGTHQVGRHLDAAALPPVEPETWPVFTIPVTEHELVRRRLCGQLSRAAYREQMQRLARADADRHPVVVPPDRGVEP